MEYDRLITILNSDSGEEDAIEITTRGALLGREDDYTICFDEDFGDGLRCSTRIRVVDRNYASILREGEIASLITLETGKRHRCLYSTPFGEMSIGVSAREIRSDIDGDGGELRLRYTVDFDGPMSGTKKDMRIKVSEIKQKGCVNCE